MEYVQVALAVMFLIIGIIMRVFKLDFLIAGYNTSSKEEKAKYDKDALCKGVSNVMFIFTAIMAAIAVLMMIFPRIKEIILMFGYIVFLIITVIVLIYMNTGGRYKIKR